MIPYGRQHVTQADIDTVIRVLQSDFLTQGPKVPLFEQAVADKVGAQYAVAANSGTSALHIACLAMGLGPGDSLWTSPITFVASANCALYCGATVDFVDIDPNTYTLCPHALEEKLKQAEQENRLPKIVTPVHMCGQPCDMAAIHDLSQQYGFKIIEDACHALGGQYKGVPSAAVNTVISRFSAFIRSNLSPPVKEGWRLPMMQNSPIVCFVSVHMGLPATGTKWCPGRRMRSGTTSRFFWATIIE